MRRLHQKNIPNESVRPRHREHSEEKINFKLFEKFKTNAPILRDKEGYSLDQIKMTE